MHVIAGVMIDFVGCLHRVEILPKGVVLFKSVRLSDAAVYTCRATNPFGSTSRNITLHVRRKLTTHLFASFSTLSFQRQQHIYNTTRLEKR